MKNPFPAVLASVLLFFFTGAASAFHSGGVAECDGCHTMHNSYAGLSDDDAYGWDADMTFPDRTGGAYAYLLQGPTPTDTCLNCHEFPGDPGPVDYHVSTPATELAGAAVPKQRTPGGDFGWLRKDYSWADEFGTALTSPGERHGHNIVAIAHVYDADLVLTTSPGGTYAAASLQCTSCHDPHGRYRRNSDGTITTTGLPIVASGSYNDSPDPDAANAVGVYRLLGGLAYAPKSNQTSPFAADPPAAVAPRIYNVSEAANDVRVAYGMGMSEWCANCHGLFHLDAYTTGTEGLRHPAGDDATLAATAWLGAGTIADNYNAYIGSGSIVAPATGISSAYTSLVPFEVGIADHLVASYTTLKGVADTAASPGEPSATGPTTSANVMCLSCHRAHASGWDSMVRWNMRGTFHIVNGVYPGTDAGAPDAASEQFHQGRTQAETIAAYNDKPDSRFGSTALYDVSYQRNLCNKCHLKD